MITYDTIKDYTDGIERARSAYREDETARQGLCVTCETRSRGDQGHRKCRACRRRDYAARK